MAIARRTNLQSGSTGSASSATVTITKPTDAVAGDVLIVTFWATDTALLALPAVSTFTGFTVVGTPPAVGTTNKYFCYFRVLGAGEPASWTLTMDRACAVSWQAIAYSGVDNTTPIGTRFAYKATPGSLLICPTDSVTPATVNDWIVAAWGDRTTTTAQKTTNWTPTAPALEQAETNTNTRASSPWCSGEYCDDGAVVGSTAATTRTSTRTGPTANTNWQSIILSLTPAAAAGTTITGVGAIPSGEAFGQNDQVRRILAPVAIGSGQAFGVAKALRLLYPLGIVSGQAFGTTRVLSPQYVLPAGIASGEAFGVTHLLRLLAPTGIVSGQAFGVAQARRTLGATGIPSAEAFGVTHLLRLLYPLGVASGETFGRPTVIGGIVPTILILSPTGIPSGEAFGTTHVLRIMAPVGVASAGGLGNTGALRRILGTVGIASSETFGVTRLLRLLRNAGAIVSTGAVGAADGVLRLLGPTGVASAGALGGADRLVRLIFPSGVQSGGAAGTPFLIYKQIVWPSGVASSEAFGIVTLSPVVSIIPGRALAFDSILRSATTSDQQLVSLLLGDVGILHNALVSDGLFGMHELPPSPSLAPSPTLAPSNGVAFGDAVVSDSLAKSSTVKDG